VFATGRVQTVAGGWESRHADGTGDLARFGMPVGVVAAADGAVYVSDAAAGAIRVVRP
jgi:hypothetical protein